MVKTKPKKTKRIVKPIYNASLTLMGKTYLAKGNTALEAIRNLKPEGNRGVGILTLESQGVRREKIVNRPLVYRLFGKGSNLMKEIASKQVSTLFDL